jgi:HD-like signal output (HDOD) protein
VQDEPAPTAEPGGLALLIEAVLSEIAEDATNPADREAALRLTSVCRGKTALPMFPHAARELDRLLRLPRPPMTSVMRVVRQEPELSRRVLELASSVAFATPCTDLDVAVTRIGLDRLWRLAMQSLVGASLFRAGPYQELADRIRMRGVMVGELASRIAPYDQRGTAYLAGLLAEVGALQVLRFAGGERGIPPASLPFVHEVRRRCQSALGVVVVHHWGLPQGVADAAAFAPRAGDAPAFARLVRSARLAIAFAAPDPELPSIEEAELRARLARDGLDPDTVLRAAHEAALLQGT